MSTKLNKRQQIAAEMLGLGSRPSFVAEKLNVNRETISRWQNDQAFMKFAQRSHLELLANLLTDRLALINQCHGAIFAVLESKEVSVLARAGVAVRYLALTGTHSNLYGGVEKRLNAMSSSEEESNDAFKNVMETLDKIAALKRMDRDMSDREYRQRIESIMDWK